MRKDFLQRALVKMVSQIEQEKTGGCMIELDY